MILDARTLETNSRGKVKGFKINVQTITNHRLYTTGMNTEPGDIHYIPVDDEE